VNTRKPQGPAPHRSPKGVPIAGNMVRKAVVFSQDESIIGLIRDGLTNGWRIEPYSEPDEARIFLQRADIGVVVIDDVAIDQQTCGWLLVQVHRWAPDALIAYIASAHTPEVERRVRSRGVQYYLSRPVDRERTLRVLHSFAVAHL
jgi:DNA-binding NtrC family response regulator